jgi:hypothetical protein
LIINAVIIAKSNRMSQYLQVYQVYHEIRQIHPNVMMQADGLKADREERKEVPGMNNSLTPNTDEQLRFENITININ